MTVKVNLLPAGYRRRQRHNRRFRIGVSIGIVLLTAELVTGLLLHARAHDARALLAQAEAFREEAADLKQRLVAPEKEMALVSQQITLAQRLRTTHHWSRLLATLSRLLPDRVVLTEVSTDPSQWTQALDPAVPAKGPPGGKSAPAPRLLKGVKLTGYAADHEDLSRFVSAIQGSRVFASASLTNASRGQYLSKEAIKFDIECRW